MGRSCLLGKRSWIPYSPQARHLPSENIGSLIDGAVTLALSCPYSRGSEDTV